MRFVKPVWTSSISFKVLLAYLVGVVFSIVIIAALLLWVMVYKSGFVSGTDIAVSTQDMTEHIRFNDAGLPVGLGDDEQDIAWVFESFKQEAAYRVLDVNGNTVLQSSAGDEFWENVTDVNTDSHFEFIYDNHLIYGATAIIHRDENTWFLQFAVSARFYKLVHKVFAFPFMGAGIILFSLVLFFVFGLCAYFTLGYTLKPLREVSQAASEISLRSIHERLPIAHVPNELKPLVESFNLMLHRLEAGYRIQQDFLATAAHELKTPLALIRAQIEMADQSEEQATLLNDVSHMSRQVQQLLMLAEVSEEHNYAFESIGISEVASEVVSFLQPMTKSNGIKLKIIQHVNTHWNADKSACFVLLKNLLENAIQHAPQHSTIEIHIDNQMIRVRDYGPGISEENLPHIFERFWRGSHRRDYGAGLGLAICHEIAQTHEWQLNAEIMNPGVRFSIRRNLNPD
ncbi:Swarming motility regulation sensor protein RssA [Thalassocella blandensis]|nr:Swarming motility regulation sensor protein RssA [Thalassocella blandensis]